MKSKYKHIFEPFTVKHMTIKNRIVMTPMGTNYGEQNGEMSSFILTTMNSVPKAVPVF